MDQTKIKEDVWETIQKLNRLWTVENNADELMNYFHENMVAISPTDHLRIVGRNACVRAWKNFTKIAKIDYWKEIDPKIEIYGDNNFAIVTYYFDMSFEMGGQVIKMVGRDMFSLVKENGKWWVVADQFSSNPQ